MMYKREHAVQIKHLWIGHKICQQKQKQSQRTSANKFVISRWLENPKEVTALSLEEKMARQNENRNFSFYLDTSLFDQKALIQLFFNFKNVECSTDFISNMPWPL